MAGGNVIRKILVKADTTGVPGLKEAVNTLNQMNRSTKDLSKNMGFLTNAFSGWLGYLGIKQVMEMSDSMMNMKNVLKVVSKDADTAADAFQKIQDIATETKQSIGQVGSVYNRFAVTLKNTSVNTSELAAITKTMINTFRLSGASTEETANAMIQFSQSMSVGKLRGQDLRSVISQNAVLATILREKFGQDIFGAAERGATDMSLVFEALSKHANKINEDAAKMATTFEQALTLSMNKARIVIGDLNEEFGLSQKFAEGMSFALDHLKEIAIAAAAVIAVSLIPSIIALGKAVQSVLVAESVLALINPWVLLAAAIGASIGAIIVYWDEVKLKGLKFINWMREAALSIDEFFQKGRELAGNKSIIDAGAKRILEEKATILKAAEDIKKLEDERAKASIKKIKEAEDAGKAIAEAGKKLGSTMEAEPLWKQINALKESFDNGKVSADVYISRMQVLADQLDTLSKKNKKFVFEFNEQKRLISIDSLNDSLRSGAIAFTEYQKAIDLISLDRLNDQLNFGQISLLKYNEEVLKFQNQFSDIGSSTFFTGITMFLSKTESLGQGIAKSIGNAFDSLETGFTDFIKTGIFNFEKFTNSVLDDLAKIVVRAAIIRPLAEGMSGFFSPSTAGVTGTRIQPGTGSYLMNATGNIFDGGLKRFASGGVVSSPTVFGYGSGKSGMMGEAGPEAILPLTRHANGDLGVQAVVTPVTVQIINNAGASVSTNETTGPDGATLIQVMVENSVKNGISSGRFDREMGQAYGISRRGF